MDSAEVGLELQPQNPMPPPPPVLPPTNIGLNRCEDGPFVDDDPNPFVTEPNDEATDAAVARALRDALNSEAARERAVNTPKSESPPPSPLPGDGAQLAFIDEVAAALARRGEYSPHDRQAGTMAPTPGEEEMDLTATFRGRRVRTWINDCGEHGPHTPSWSPDAGPGTPDLQETVVPQDSEYKYGVEDEFEDLPWGMFILLTAALVCPLLLCCARSKSLYSSKRAHEHAMTAAASGNFFGSSCPAATWTPLWFIAVSPSVLKLLDYPDKATSSEIFAPAILYVISYVAWACGFSAECIRRWTADSLDPDAVCHVAVMGGAHESYLTYLWNHI